MSDYPVGPDWWQASDGRWYPPQGQAAPPEPTAPQPQAQPPAAAPQPGYGAPGYGYQPTQPLPPGPPSKPKSNAPLIVALIALLALVGGVVGFLLIRGDGDDEAADDATTTTAEEEEEEEEEETTTTEEEGDGDLDIDVPDGFKAVVSEDEGFAIAVPEEWQEFDLSDPAVQDQLDQFAEANPEIGAALDQAGGIIEAGGVLMAIEPGRTPFAPNVNILKSPSEIDVEVLESAAAGQLEAIGARNITTDIVDLPAGEALTIEYDLAANLPDGSAVDAHGVQFQVPAGGSTWAITFSTDDIDRDGDTFDEMIETFTVAD